ncbi:MAG: aspartate--tRNA ligase [Spirochaetaceae bacterium]|nr:aspartate--tRNA ligase [Spirochaetaceae bacterium]
MKRTVSCGDLRAACEGQNVVLNGWVDTKRDHGGISFINIRDRYGITQLVADTNETALDAETKEALAALHNEYCIAVRGIVRKRPPQMINKDMPTGEVEVLVNELVTLNSCEPLPFQIEDETKAKEELRLKYRYLDLRSAAMQRRIALRSQLSFATREFLTKRGFYEIETPTFVRSTPEGARDYLVPSRLYPGKFYALPQSPQIYKQLLMVSCFDKYFQLARCYRDEDARGDRQPEFTQIDIEMSFVSRDDVLCLTEELMAYIFKRTLDIELPACFTRISYDEAIRRFGTDKPDLRFSLELQDFSPFADIPEFSAFKNALIQGEEARKAAAEKGISKAGGAVTALVVPGKADYSRKQIEELEAHSKIYRSKGMAWMKVSGSKEEPILEGGVSKFFKAQTDQICASLGAKPGDLILIIADADSKIAHIALGAVRSKLGKDLGLCDPMRFEFAWIVDFPLFEYNEEEKRWEAAHHMFSYPQEEFHAVLESDPGVVKGDLYDLVLNGYELASGSIRIHNGDLQKRIFKIVGLSEEEAEKKFGFLTSAFKYGAPPHGGIAPGLDRLVMLMSGESSIKEVIAFPKNSFAESPMDGSPGEVDKNQLDELHLVIKND